MSVQVEGVAGVLSNLNTEIGKMKGRTNEGLFAAGLLLQRESQKLTPVDTGNLKASAYTRRENFGVQIGYTSAYAIFVHENLEARHTTGQAKFLETALNESQAKMLELVERYARVK